jgi:site-specific DNA recombinase
MKAPEPKRCAIQVVYRGEVHAGEHEPILDRDLFETVQAKLAANAVARKVRLRGSASILTGRIYDDRGNPMSPTHSNKLGVRYRYYVSHALLQRRQEEAGSITRLPAPEIEQLVLDSVRRHLETTGLPSVAAACDLIEHHVDRVIVRPQAVEVRIISSGSTEPTQAGVDEPASGGPTTTTLTLPWTAPSFSAIKGIIHEPTAKPAMSAESRDALLAVIAKARGWIEDLRLGRVASLSEIADRGGLGERHVRFLAPLAFVAQRVVAAIADGSGPADLTVTGLAKALPYSWAEQEQRYIRKR